MTAREENLVRRALSRIGLVSTPKEVDREDESILPTAPEPQPAPFYHVSPTCQVPNLGFLYGLIFGERHDGTFVEIGAYDGISYSNTSCLAEAGWTGVYVEPVPEYADRCRENNRDRPAIKVVNQAIGSQQGVLSLHVGEYLTTPSDAQLLEYQGKDWGRGLFDSAVTITVEMTTLNALLDSTGMPVGFDLLVVDVEGFEVDVFEGFDLEKWKPNAMIVELKDAAPESSIHRASHQLLGRSIVARGYEVIYKDGINTFFARSDAAREPLSDGN